MHPALADRRWFALHVALWVTAGCVIALVARTALGFPWMAAAFFGLPLGLVGGAGALSAWYVLRATPADVIGSFRAAVTVMVSSLVTAALWASAAQLWWTVIAAIDAEVPSVDRPGAFTLLVSLGIAGYLAAAAAYQVGHTLEATSRSARRALEADVAQREAELRALRAQVNPHFLFNSLNSIAGLIGVEPGRAREMCQLLGEFLRESLLVGAAARISLAREVALIEQYLFIEKVRFGSRLDVSIAMAGDTADASVPPLLLQPLVENAVRHGVATRLEGGTITVVTRRAGDRVIVTIENPRDEDARRGGTGFGLGIVRRRLQAAFDRGEGALAIEAAPDTYRVSVTFPWEDIS